MVCLILRLLIMFFMLFRIRIIFLMLFFLVRLVRSRCLWRLLRLRLILVVRIGLFRLCVRWLFWFALDVLCIRGACRLLVSLFILRLLILFVGLWLTGMFWCLGCVIIFIMVVIRLTWLSRWRGLVWRFIVGECWGDYLGGE